MEYIFLDIDGVLNGHEQYSNGYCGIKPSCVEYFNELLEYWPKAKIVISSAWRYMVLCKTMTIKGFENLLLIHGINCKDKVIDCISADKHILESRGEQIREWLNHKFLNPILLPIPKYIILDDMLIEDNNHYRTDSCTGLTKQDVEQIKLWFRG